jgi:hypothetical protein
MAAQPHSASSENRRRRSTARPQEKASVSKSTRCASTRSSARLQHLQPPPSPSAPTHQSARTKRKRPQDSEAEVDELEGVRPPKQPREIAPSEHKLFERKLRKDVEAEPNKQEPSPSRHWLSEKNLQILETLNGGDMDPAASTPKRTSSRRSSQAGTERTQRSSDTAAAYRRINLAAVKISMHAEPPDYIQAAINHIINAEVSQERQSQLHVVAQELRDLCLESAKALAGEDDFVNPLRTALEAMRLDNLCTHEKADWRWELKPEAPQQSRFDFSLMHRRDQQPQFDEITGARTHAPANDLQALNTMPAPAPSGSAIKTPRPDISIGIKLTALISALSSQNLDEVDASEFLEQLQNEMLERAPDRPLEPMLISLPASRALDLAFPFAVIEGKAYATGKQIFEAENQASVAGACGLKIQLDLDDLVSRVATGSNSLPTTSNTRPPLFFTICTQGPIHELWAHWTVVRNGRRMFKSKLIDSCNALLLQQGKDFLTRLSNICLWGLGPFMESVVERLGIVAGKVRAQ